MSIHHVHKSLLFPTHSHHAMQLKYTHIHSLEFTQCYHISSTNGLGLAFYFNSHVLISLTIYCNLYTLLILLLYIYMLILLKNCCLKCSWTPLCIFTIRSKQKLLQYCCIGNKGQNESRLVRFFFFFNNVQTFMTGSFFFFFFLQIINNINILRFVSVLVCLFICFWSYFRFTYEINVLMESITWFYHISFFFLFF